MSTQLQPLPAGPRPAPDEPPKLTFEQIESAVLVLLKNNWNNLAWLLARPDELNKARARVDRAMRAEEYRQLEALHNIANEARRRNS